MSALRLLFSFLLASGLAFAQNTVTWVSSSGVLSNTVPASTRLYSAADAGGGTYSIWQWNPSSTATSDGVNVIKWTGANLGRWVRVQPAPGSINEFNSLLVKTNLSVLGSSTITNLTLDGTLISLQYRLKEWTKSSAYTVSSAAYSASGVLTNATVKWPDSVSGVFNSTVNSTFQLIDSFTITHAGSTTHTVTQPSVTRNSAGYVTSTPDLTVTP